MPRALPLALLAVTLTPTAAVLDCRPGTVKSRLARALADLRALGDDLVVERDGLVLRLEGARLAEARRLLAR